MHGNQQAEHHRNQPEVGGTVKAKQPQHGAETKVAARRRCMM
jgi:hypothetical protein